MIDTIVIDIDCLKNFNVRKNIDRYTQSYNKNMRTDLRAKVGVDYTTFQQFYTIPSYHEGIKVAYNEANKRLRINTSIPKFLGGNNLMMLLPLRNETDIRKALYSAVPMWVELFIKQLEKITGVLNLEYVYVYRIDLCVNFPFNTKMDALSMLEEFKKIPIKYDSERRNKYLNYQSSLMFLGRSWSFKIYHKGTEMKRNHKLPDLDKLLPVAERTLRFEMSMQKKFIDYTYRTKLYRQFVDDKTFKQNKDKAIEWYLSDGAYSCNERFLSFKWVLNYLIEIFIDKMDVFIKADTQAPNIPSKYRTLLYAFGSFKEMYKQRLISQRTYYRLKKNYGEVCDIKYNYICKDLSKWNDIKITNWLINSDRVHSRIVSTYNSDVAKDRAFPNLLIDL